MPWRQLGHAAVACAAVLVVQPVPALAQAAGSVSRPVVQPLPARGNEQLTSALSQLAKNPRDVEALVDAGRAALAMGDFEAATGFFRRADQISPNNARVKAGLASAAMHSGDPVSAIPLFAAAEQAGLPAGMTEGERGLAYDLVGDTASAQALYRKALALRPDDEITRRLAISLAISGDAAGSEAVLMPLLRKQDKAGWRTRVFALAIMGQAEESIRVATTMLPEGLAENMAPYLRYMPRLTTAQKAAAANLGSFPRASEIGRDDPRIAQYAAQHGVRPAVASLGDNLLPKGAPLGSGATAKTSRRKGADKAEKTPPAVVAAAPVPAPPALTRTAPPEPMPSRTSSVAKAPPAVSPTATVAVAEAPKGRATPSAPSPTATPAAKPAPAAPASGFDLAGLSQSKSPAPSAPLASSTPPAPQPDGSVGRVSLADIFADLGKPETDAAPADGAVDIRKIRPAMKPVVAEAPVPAAKAEKETEKGKVAAKDAVAAKDKLAAKDKATTKDKVAATDKSTAKDKATVKDKAGTKEDAKSAKSGKGGKAATPSHPSRTWVQIGVGRSKAAMAFDWRKYTRENAAVFKGKKPSTTNWGQTNRLLVGPFETEKAAKDYLAKLSKVGLKGPHVWISPAGQAVEALPLD